MEATKQPLHSRILNNTLSTTNLIAQKVDKVPHQQFNVQRSFSVHTRGGHIGSQTQDSHFRRFFFSVRIFNCKTLTTKL